ncbi:hypothetical protein, partial [Rhodoferax sp.]|uniref:hypothetical protein n=1 Tax=Rhodoferax sp. TaxID=50421 RepID=UPI0025EB42E5
MVSAPVPWWDVKNEKEEEKKTRVSVHGFGICMRLSPVVSKLTGFQDSEPGVGFGGFGAKTWAGP